MVARRVDRAVCTARPPTDPDVRNCRIRFLSETDSLRDASRLAPAGPGSSRASSAIRWSLVETVSGFSVPVIFPSSSSVYRRPPSLHGVPWVGSPASSVLLRRYDSPRPSRTVRTFSRPGTVCAHRHSLPRSAVRCLAGPGPLFQPGGLPSPACLTRSRRGLPGSWANPRVRSPQVSDPGRTPRARPVSAQGVLPPPPERRRPPQIVISRLNLAALALAVYALQRGSPRTTQDSLPAGGQPLPGRAFTCWVRSRRFQCSLSRLHLPLLQAYPGAYQDDY